QPPGEREGGLGLLKVLLLAAGNPSAERQSRQVEQEEAGVTVGVAQRLCPPRYTDEVKQGLFDAAIAEGRESPQKANVQRAPAAIVAAARRRGLPGVLEGTLA